MAFLTTALLLIFLKLTGEVLGSTDGTLFFPDDEKQSINYFAQSVQSEAEAVHGSIPQILERSRNATVYEQYVNRIITRGIAKLTIEINKFLKTQTGNKENIVLSPFSVTSALALVLLGSVGETFEEIAKFLGLHIGFSDYNKRSQVVHEQFAHILTRLNETSGFRQGHEVHIATAVFVQAGYPIRSIYKTTAEELYQCNILNVDFGKGSSAAQSQVNNWVAEKTHNKIKSILDEVPSSNTKVIVANALYFNAEWENHFMSGLTKRTPFYTDGIKSNTNIQVDMMTTGGFYPYHRDLGLECEILGIPYKDKKDIMYVVIPFDSTRDKLLQFESKITEDDLYQLVRKTIYSEVIIQFPKMKLDRTVNLKETLQAMGITSLFNPKEANLGVLSPGENVLKAFPTNNVSLNLQPSSLEKDHNQAIDNIRQILQEQSDTSPYTNPGLYADNIIHKVYMDISEKGTEAAAATIVSLSKSGKRVIRANVPFCFFILNIETDAILFWGSVVTPNPSYLKVL